jgi:glycosyltransferase involved in cell wall biosynthesis
MSLTNFSIMETMRIGFLSFRIAGNDGVSLEAVRWRTVLTRMGHKVIFIAGELDQKGVLLPDLHFTNPQIHRIHEAIVSENIPYKQVESRIFSLAGEIEGELREVFRQYHCDQLIVANVFSLPMHFPLAVALERVITELEIPTISRNHDFWWERSRYAKSSYFDFFRRYFPPGDPIIRHVTINNIAQREMKDRTGLSSTVIGDSFDFKSKLNRLDQYALHWRKDFKIKEDNLVFLQPTRIVARKRIEVAIDLVKRLNDERIILVLSGNPTDEGIEYALNLRETIAKSGIRYEFIGHRIDAKRKIINDNRVYTLWDCFVNCDFVTYASSVEGFGNQLIEAIYFKKPLLINRYAVYKSDLEPLGIKAVTMNGYLTDRAVQKVKDLLDNEDLRKRFVEQNFRIGQDHFSFEVLREKLKSLGL